MQETCIDITGIKDVRKTLIGAGLRVTALFAALTAVWVLFVMFSYLLPAFLAVSLPMLLATATGAVLAITVRAATVLKPQVAVIRQYRAGTVKNPQQVRMIISYVLKAVSTALIIVGLCFGIAAIPTLIYTSPVNTIGGYGIYIIHTIIRVFNSESTFPQFVIAAGIIIDAAIIAKLISHCVKVFGKNAKTAAK